jgi:16S rRNA (uracil1498-N3)-methyltransferase
MPHLVVFYTPPDRVDSGSGELEIAGQEAHHIRKVLRHKPGDQVVVVDGCGNAYWVTLTEIRQEYATGEIGRSEQHWRESPVPIGVIIPPLKGQRVDGVIEKGTELGASWFRIPRTEHAVAKVTPHKLDRWRRIALAAMKQCGRSVLPSIQQFPDLASAVGDGSETDRQPLIFYADPEGAQLSEAIKDTDHILKGADAQVYIAVGPEGGFSDEERRLLGQHGAVAFSLGSRRLRSDTAVIAALSQLNGLI